MTANPSIDREWMELALDLAARGEGLTRPNPPVGAVVVKKNKVLGRGWHRKAGGPHAEIFALREAGRRARGATLYVTLEPCSTTGRTPPCTEAILHAGIKRVVVAVRDPNPIHTGRGIRRLRSAGVLVECGLCKDQAEELVRPFSKWIRTGYPWMTLKLGMTSDGRIADHRGHSRWITSASSRRVVQALRRRSDAIVVGAGTFRADDPSLIPRPALGRRPLRVILAGARALPTDARVMRNRDRFPVLFALPVAHESKHLPAEVSMPLRGSTDRARIADLLKQLGRKGCLRILCEGGGGLAASLLRANLVDEVQLFVAPLFLGGDGVPSVREMGLALSDARQFRLHHIGSSGPDAHLVLRRIS